MGSNSHLFSKKPLSETILGKIAKRYAHPFSPEEIKRLNELQKERNFSVRHFNTDDERVWLDSSTKK